MVRELTKIEENAIIKHCKGNKEYCDCLNKIIKQYLSIEPDTKYVADEILDTMVMQITDLTNYFNIELCNYIYDRDLVEDLAKMQLRESLEQDELNLYLIKSLADFETFGGVFMDNWFVECIATPRFEVLTYDILGMLIQDLIYKIIDKIEEEGEWE